MLIKINTIFRKKTGNQKVGSENMQKNKQFNY